MTELTEAGRSDGERITASLAAGWQLPASLYSNPEVYETEKEHVFAHSWQYVGREKDLADPGSYLTAQLGDLPIVVVRDKNGCLHAHVNVCRHRLHPVAEGAGCKQLFQCRYHGWTYTHDGSLRSAPGLQDEDAFDRRTLGLRPVLVDTLNGFVFANPDIAAQPLRDFLGGAVDMLPDLHLDFASWEHSGTFTYDIPANWKLFTENALECYHCPLVHETTYATAFHTTKKNYVCTEFDNVAIQVAPVTNLTEQIAGKSGLGGFRMLFLWPVSFISVDDFVGIIARTVPTGSQSSRFIVDTFVKPGTDPQVLEQWLDIYDRTFDEDKVVVAAQQAGYDSGAVPQGRLMTNCESTISMFQRRTWQALSASDHNAMQNRPRSAAVPRIEQTAVAATAGAALWEADLRIEAITAEAEGVVSLTLSPPSGTELPNWEPGAHIDLCLTDGLVRQYSLCGDPGTSGSWRVAVLREPSSRGGSAYVHDRIAPGQALRVRGPRNHFALPDAPSYLFVAGGIGITPILPMIGEVERLGKPWRLLYGGRSVASMAFTDQLAVYGDKVFIRPQDKFGRLDLDTFLGVADPGTAVMACGPTPLLDALEEICSRHELTLHTERFTAADQSNLINTAFDVELARTGRTVRVEADKSILETVREHGVSVLSSCKEGVCGTCETPVLDGIPEHRDTVLTEDEKAAGGTMVICVSRCRSGRLILDL